ncbi:MAG: hypothetical protein WCF85_06530 [Rhodospirillaceae bacterium]
MKGILLLVLGLILLLAAGGGGYYAYQKFLNPPATSEAAEPAKPTKPEPEPPPVYVRLQPVAIPVIGADHVEQLITMVITLRVADQNAALQISQRMPRVVDSFLTTLYGAMDEGEILNGNLVNIKGVKIKLQTISDQLLGSGVVKEVLVQTVLQRRL